jgi:hypothetical protein
MAQIATFTVTNAGGAPTFLPAAAGDTAAVGPGIELEVRNGAGSSITVTITAVGVLDSGDAYPAKVYTVAAGGEARIPLNLAAYKNATDQLAHLTWSSTTTVTRAVTRHPQ